MEQIGALAPMVVFAYAFGMVWYHILKRPTTNWLRIIGYPLMGIALGEGLWANYMVSGPSVLGIHIVVALFATLIAVGLDIAVEKWQTAGGFNFNVKAGQQNGSATRSKTPTHVQ